MRKATVTALGIAVAVLAWWFWPASDGPPRHAEGPTDSVRDASGARSVGRLEPGSASEREVVAESRRDTADGGADTWTIRLTGVDPAVPWTGSLMVTFEDRFEVRCESGEDGAFRFVPPRQVRSPGFQFLRLSGDDANYRMHNRHHRTDRLRRDGEDEFRVDPIAELRGRVLGPEGEGVDARVRAFTLDANGPREPLLGRVDTDVDGSYAIQVPPGVPVLLVADALDSGRNLMLGSVSEWTPLLIDPEDRRPATIDLSMSDSRRARLDRVPASLSAEGVFTQPREVPDLRIAATARLTGRVAFADGRPLGHVEVVARPQWATGAPWHRKLHFASATGVVAEAGARANANGEFAMQLARGVPFEVSVASTDPVFVAGSPRAVATAPGRVGLEAPGGLVTVRVVADGRAVSGAFVDVGERTWSTDSAGRLRVVPGPEPVVVRARAGVRSSAWSELPRRDAPTDVEIELVAADLVDVALTLRAWSHG